MTTRTSYPSYKPSGIDWLGDIPSHWQERRGISLYRKIQRPVEVGAGTVTAFRDGQVTLRTNRRTQGFTEAIQEIGYQGVRTGDLVIHAMDAFAGAVGVSESDGKCSPVCSVCVPVDVKEAEPKYMARCLREIAHNGYIQAQAKGIRERSTDFRFDSFGNNHFPLPPLDEQRAIADYLDRKDAEITRFIESRRRMVALLEEKKQAIVNQAVTRGLDPSVPMKASGVEWLGEIPSHWEVRRVPRIFRYRKGKWAAQLTKEYAGSIPGPYPVYSGQTEDNGVAGLIDRFEFDLGRPAIFVTTVGARAMSTRIVEGRFSLSQNCALIEDNNDHTAVTYMIHAFDILFRNVRSTISLIMQPSLRFSDLNKYTLPFPPIDEQLDIAEKLSHVDQLISRQISRMEREMELMQEYRTRLTSDVVTGKVRVG